ncbi:MAG TPA: class I SAM-dependent methyltransferase [Pyrinomonadaceae bacterium]|nr:class I SAM-dependent methyltransferase [Pyrinomonadaceae bacterium]
MNLFSPKSAARRYREGRFYFHPIVIERIRKFLSLSEPLTIALDVGCGTGLSSIALKELSRLVVGVDASVEMVALADKEPRVEYLVSRAEELPFKDGVFEMITLSQAFHWLDKERFFAEARRVLCSAGSLIFYDHYFSSEMEDNPEFRSWFQANYLKRFPSPPRGSLAFTTEDSDEGGFQLQGQESLQNSLSFTVEGLVNYLLSHSNVIAAVEFGNEEIDEVRLWLTESIKPLFDGLNEASFIFNAPIWFLQKSV